MKQELKGKIGQAIEAVLPELLEIAKELYENPEIGGAEKQTSKLLAAGWKRMVSVWTATTGRCHSPFVLYVIPASPVRSLDFSRSMTHCRRSDTAVVII